MSKSFNYHPSIHGKLVSLRPLYADDYDDLFAVASDPLVWAQHPDRERYKETNFRVFFDQALASPGALIITANEGGQVIGSSRFHGYSESRNEVEIGWSFLARHCWGGSYNGEVKQLMLQYAFQSVERVVFLIGPENIRSQRAVEKIGGIRAGTRTDGNGQASVVYQISASEYLPHT